MDDSTENSLRRFRPPPRAGPIGPSELEDLPRGDDPDSPDFAMSEEVPFPADEAAGIVREGAPVRRVAWGLHSGTIPASILEDGRCVRRVEPAIPAAQREIRGRDERKHP